MVNPYLEGNFAPVLEERTDERALEVDGVIPPDLDGRLLRNGPNPVVRPADPSDYHWFTGDGMIHAVSLAGGKAVGYRNRWVRTRTLATKVATVPPKGPTEPVDGPSNTHVIRHAGTTLALVESGFPLAVSDSLDRSRIHDFDSTLSSPMCAHPKLDPATGKLLFFGVDVFGPPYLRLHAVDPGGELVATEEVEIPRAVMMHDFGVTATRIALMDQPVVFDLSLAGRPGLPFRWDPGAGARLGVLPRSGSGADVQWASMDPCYVFHVVNAFDDGERTVLDVIRYDTMFETGPGEVITRSRRALHRWTFDPGTNRVHEEMLDDRPVEFPRIDPATAGTRNRYAYATLLGQDMEHPSFDGLVKYDFARNESVRFDPGPDRYPTEPVFVRAADGAGEDEGWVLAVVYDATRGASDLVVLDATSFAGPPVATVRLPARVPFGFHGSWIPSDT